MQVPSLPNANSPSLPFKPAASSAQLVAAEQPAPLVQSGDSHLISSPSGPGIGPIPLFGSPPPLAQCVEEAVQRVWEYARNPGQQDRILGQFKQALNQCCNEELPPTFIYSDQELTESMQQLQARIEAIQRRLDDGTPDCGGGMAEELEACLKTQQAMHEALQLRYL